jgi:transcriptional regulator with XRE-family HTH domain
MKPSKNTLLHRLRLEHGWTKEELARQAEVSSQTIRKAERGFPLREDSMAKIARALEASPGEIFAERWPT